MKDDPHLSEFEAKILHYKELEQQIVAEEEHYDVGPIALCTGQFTGHSAGGRNIYLISHI